MGPHPGSRSALITGDSFGSGVAQAWHRDATSSLSPSRRYLNLPRFLRDIGSPSLIPSSSGSLPGLDKCCHLLLLPRRCRSDRSRVWASTFHVTLRSSLPERCFPGLPSPAAGTGIVSSACSSCLIPPVLLQGAVSFKQVERCAYFKHHRVSECPLSYCRR